MSENSEKLNDPVPLEGCVNREGEKIGEGTGADNEAGTNTGAETGLGEGKEAGRGDGKGAGAGDG